MESIDMVKQVKIKISLDSALSIIVPTKNLV